MVQTTLAVIKPDGVMKGVQDKIRKRYTEAGLRVIWEMPLELKEPQVRELYKYHAGQHYFEGLILSMVSGPCVAIILEGENAIQLVRKLNGATDPAKAEPGTIRHDFPSAGGPFNMVHGSDSVSSAAREIHIVTGGKRPWR